MDIVQCTSLLVTNILISGERPSLHPPDVVFPFHGYTSPFPLERRRTMCLLTTRDKPKSDKNIDTNEMEEERDPTTERISTGLKVIQNFFKIRVKSRHECDFSKRLH